MRLDEPARRSLYEALARSLGDTEADALMNLLPTHPLADMATRDDLNSLAVALRGEMALGFGAVDRRFGEIQGQFGEIQGQFGEIQGQFAKLEGKMAAGFGAVDRQFGELRTEHARDLRVMTLMLIMMNLATTTVIVSLGLSGTFA